MTEHLAPLTPHEPSGADSGTGGSPDSQPSPRRETLLRPRAAPLEARNRRVTFALDPDALGCVDLLAERMGRTRSEMLRELLLVGIVETLAARDDRSRKGVGAPSHRKRKGAARVSPESMELVVRAIEERRANPALLPPPGNRSSP